MAISGNYSDDMNEMRHASASKLEVFEERLAELTRMREALRGLVDACPGHGPLETRPIIASLPATPPDDEPPRRSPPARPHPRQSTARPHAQPALRPPPRQPTPT